MPGDPRSERSEPEQAARGERAFLARWRERLPRPAAGQVWMGDDAAVLGDDLLLAADVMVEGVHFDLGWCSPADVGWKALAVNLSDLVTAQPVTAARAAR